MTKSSRLAPLLAIGLFAFLILAVQPVTAHGAPGTREIDTRVLVDNTGAGDYGAAEDVPGSPGYEGGHDLLALDLREAYGPDRAPGIYFRLIAQRGDASLGTLSALLHLDVAGQSITLDYTTEDGTTYTSDSFDLIFDAVPVGDGFPYAVDAFASYATLGATPGDELENIRLEGFVGEKMADVAPGTYHYQGTLIPYPLASTDLGSFTLTGPPELLIATINITSWENAADLTQAIVLPVTLKTTLTTLEQFATLDINAPDGWTVTLDNDGIALKPDAPERIVNLTLTAAPGAQSGELTLHALTELGGLATANLELPGMPATGDDSNVVSPELTPGQTFRYTFSKVGVFSYHDHKYPASQGTITIRVADEGHTPTTHTISIMEDNPDDKATWHFHPADLTIQLGDTIEWRNDGQNVHMIMGGLGGHSHDDHDHDHTDQDSKDAPGPALPLLLIGLAGILIHQKRRT